MVNFRWQGVRCREYLGRRDITENRADARRLARRIDGEIAGGTFDYLKYFPDGRKKHLFAREPAETSVVPPFGAFAREWLRNKKAWFSPGTFYDRERIIEGKLIPFFGAEGQIGSGIATSPRLVSAITPEDIEQLINAVKAHPGIRGAKLSNRRANIILDVLRQILDRAVARGWLARNPAREISKLREDHPEIDPFSFGEAKTLLDKGFRDAAERRYFGRKSAANPSRVGRKMGRNAKGVTTPSP